MTIRDEEHSDEHASNASESSRILSEEELALDVLAQAAAILEPLRNSELIDGQHELLMSLRVV